METVHPIIYEDETGQLSLEWFPGLGAIIHCYSYKWDKETYKHYKRVWKIFLEKFGSRPLYAAIADNDKKLQKFAKRFGFILTDLQVYCDSGVVRRLYKCTS